MIGIDFENSQDIAKGKYKICGHLGKNISNGEPFDFIELSDVVCFTLDMSITIPLPSDPTLGDLPSRITNIVKKNLVVYQKDKKSSATTLLTEN